jgi:succinoglycan biosynthesis transport protein ExoP
MDSFKNQPPQETKLHFLDYWRIIRIRKAIIITVFLITAIIATAVTFILPESYSSTARIKIEPDTTSDISNIGGQMSTSSPYDAYFIQTEFEIMQSQIVLGKVIQALNLNVEWGKKYFHGETLKTEETVRLLKQRMDLQPERNTKLIDITVYAEDKNDAAALANAIANAYKSYRLDLHKQQTQGGIDVLESEYADEEQKIRSVQTNVDNLRKELAISDTDPNSLTPQPTLTQDQLRQLHQELLEGRTKYTKMESQVNELKKSSPENLKNILPTVITDAQLSDLLGKYNEARQKFVTLTNDYSLANPEVIRVQSLIDELNHQIDARVSGIMIGMDSQVKSEKASLDAQETAMEQATVKDQEEAVRGQPYWEAKRQLGSLLDFHRLLAAKIESEKLDLAIPKSSMVTMVDIAKPGLAPVKPNKPLNIALGLIIGLIMGVGLAFFIEYLDTSVKTIDDVERTFQAPVLGVIPQNVGYLMSEGPESKHAEAYRVLRTNILFSRKDDKLNSIVVVSAGAGEGKSTTTLNLATVFAQSGQRILVVDSDLRRPTLHKLMGVTNNIGLTNYLLKQNTLEEVIQTSAVPMLDFMASGKLPSSSMGILGSVQMSEMITALKGRYDFVFFDSPPILGVSDASVLASEMDMVIQVIQYRRYPQPMNMRAKQVIEKVGGNFIGIVLNNINLSQDESYYYYSGYYHDEYYTRNEDQQSAATPKPSEGDTNNTGIKQKY